MKTASSAFLALGLVTSAAFSSSLGGWARVAPDDRLSLAGSWRFQLDGADAGLVHFINEIKPEDVKIGMRVEALFKEDRIGSILDIKYFKPYGI